MSQQLGLQPQTLVKSNFNEFADPDDADFGGYPCYKTGGMKDMWQNMKNRSQGVGAHSQPDTNTRTLWSDSSCSLSGSDISSVSGLSSDTDALQISSTSSAKKVDASSSAQLRESPISPSKRAVWINLRESSSKKTSWSDMGDTETEEQTLQPSNGSASSASSLPVEAKIVSQEPKKTRARPPKAQRVYAKKLAHDLFDAITDEDREAAEMAIMDATEDDPVVYEYAMTVLQCLRSSWRSSLADC